MSPCLTVVGLGYVGLPLARRACSVGLGVVGVDSAPAVVAGLTAGRSHVGDVSDADVRAMLGAGFRATGDPAAVAGADTVVVCVPTGLTADRAPDLADLVAAVDAVGAHLRPGTLVVVESTSWPGTTDELVRPILERGGLRAGLDFALAYSPERIDPGNTRYGLATTPKVVAGHTPVCAKRAQVFYESLAADVVVAAGTREAEMAKLLENAYRSVNIALVNEVARICDALDIDVWDVVRCAGTKPFGFSSFRPGPGVGGHCIPVDPVYLAHRAAAAGVDTPLIAAAGAVNGAMPAYVAERAGRLLDRTGRTLAGADVLLLGVTYKPDVADVRETPAVPVARALRAAGARVRYHDPYVPAWTVDGVPVPRAEDPARPAADLAIVLADHGCYDLDALAATVPALLDTRGRIEDTGHAERL
ncbi:nucleotide sugar dehydrogenase [Actinocatenispora rupis]|uniref:UDP-N-acetyl-D-glucosamine dehydrogenase n=1 Tax=Actinocatenispora rupis TaxID=519421 RepID=A0A8J3IW30_9ACTN|nr:nucleotide sugar dehydrogenase [Actinocatenispora rupis]GID11021.1 UDP-N-acetyl-D-glucosamine dehydrogenase [Actinocatenispora rupis]